MARLLGASPLQIELSLVRIGKHKTKNTSEDHLLAFYQTWRTPRTGSSTASSSPARRSRRSPMGTSPSAMEQIFDWYQTTFHSTRWILLLGYHGRTPSFPRRAEASSLRRRRSGSTGGGSWRLVALCFTASPTIPRSDVGASGRDQGRDIAARPGIRRSWRIPTRRASAVAEAARSGASMCSTISNIIRARSRTKYFPGPQGRGPDELRASTPERRHVAEIAGGPTPICCSPTGSTRSIRRRRSTSI